MMRRRTLLPLLAIPVLPLRAAEPVRVGSLRYGSVKWELDVMRAHGFGGGVQEVELAAGTALAVALQAGHIDLALQDWLWVSRQRASGADWTFAPATAALGAVMVPEASPLRDVPALEGKRLGVAGGPLDKSWLLLRAYAQARHGLDLDARTEKTFGPPPLLDQQLAAGRLDAVLTYWPFAARGEAQGRRPLFDMADALAGVGAPRGLPMLGMVFSSAWAGRNRPALDAFLDGARRARAVLAESDAEWERIAPLTGAADAAELARLRAWYRRGIPDETAAADWPAAAARLYATLGRRGRRRSGGKCAGVGAGHVLAAGIGALRPALTRAAPILLLLLAWEGLGRALDTRLFPSLGTVLQTLATEAASGRLAHNLAATLRRVAWAFALAMALGSLLGIAMGRSRTLDRLLDSLVTGLLNLPALVGIVLIYVWFGLSEITAIAAVALNKLPNTAVTLREGARAVDTGLLEMAASFRVSRLATIRHVMLPHLAPYFFAAARSGLSLIWKIVLVAELLGRSDGVGFQIQVYFQLFDVAGILAYTLAFIVVVQLIEWVLLQPLERRANRWR